MDKTIIEIIDRKAARLYKKMTEAKKQTYRTLFYVGVQTTLNGYPVKAVAKEIGYTERGTYKLVHRWEQMISEGNVTANLIVTAIQKLPVDKRYSRSDITTITEPCVSKEATPKQDEEITPEAKKKIVTAPTSNKLKKVLGFIIHPEDEKKERAAIRDSILYFRKYGKGRQPRMNGEYYSPGTNPSIKKDDNGNWLPLDTAALYCGCKEELISNAGQKGVIERRIYLRNANRNYYEYKLSDLDRFIANSNLI